MTILSTMKENGDYDSFISEGTDLLASLLNESYSPQDLSNLIEEQTFETNISTQDDDATGQVPENLVSEAYTRVSPLNADGSPKSQETINEEASAVAEHEYNRRNLQSRGSYNRPITPQFVNTTVQNNVVTQDTSRAISNYSSTISSESNMTKKRKQKALKQAETDYSNNYKKIVNTVERENVDWGRVLSREAKNPVDAIDRLRSFITYNIGQKYGGWSRITSVIVRDGSLILNNSMYIPVIEPQYVNANIFPVDTLNYIRGGKLAYLFDWGALKKMKSLHSVDIDDTDLYVTTIGADLGVGRNIGVVTIFRFCRNLDVLTLGNETITRDSLNKPKSAPIKKKVDTTKRFLHFSDGYHLNIYRGTNGIQNYMYNNLRNYAIRRGNKAIHHFCCGVLARATLFVGATMVNIAVHGAGGIMESILPPARN